MVIAQRQRFRMREEHAARVARAHEEERAWVAAELHDDVLQRIALVRHEVATLEPDALDTRLRGINAELLDLAVAVRGIAQRLHPTMVDQVGLLLALRELADEFRRSGAIDVSLDLPESSLQADAEVARAAYRIVQEALRNAAKHSGGAHATVSVEVDQAARRIIVRVQDDGAGYDPHKLEGRGVGLATLRERARAVNGSAVIDAHPGRGVLVQATLPLGDATAAPAPASTAAAS